MATKKQPKPTTDKTLQQRMAENGAHRARLCEARDIMQDEIERLRAEHDDMLHLELLQLQAQAKGGA